jgi:tetratricopeptide (TPR) repeat protein
MPASSPPLSARQWFEQGVSLQRAGNSAGALDAFRQSLRLDAAVAAPWIGLAQVLEANSQFEDARGCLERAVAAEPGNAVAHQLLATALKNLGMVGRAQLAFDAALRLDPSSAATHFGIGQLAEDRGDPQAAASHYRTALEIAPLMPEAIANLLGLGKHIDISDEIALANAVLAEDDPRAVALVGYGLGKALDRMGRFKEAFRAFDAANTARQKVHGRFDRVAFDQRIDRLIAIFDRAFFAARKSWGNPSRQPIFVVGLPRSGTTLTEQIIAAHPQCFGAGELAVLSDLATGTPDRIARHDLSWPDTALSMTSDHAASLAQYYLAQSRLRADPTAIRVVDKQPLNFWHLGLVALTMPGARIIHCTRDIRDCGLSIFTQNFSTQQKWATSLDDIAHYWRGYRRLMQHWAEVTDLAMLEIAYEETVADLETQSRRLLDFAGLEWDARTLAFHEQERAVQTPSRWQVREPIYQTSKARWRNYSDHLGALMAAAEAQ